MEENINTINNNSENNVINSNIKPVITRNKNSDRSFTFIFFISFLIALATGIFSGTVTAVILAKYFPNIDRNTVSVVSEQSSVINVVKETNSAVVSIIVESNNPTPQVQPLFNNFFGITTTPQPSTTPQEIAGGSGFLISPNGLILTNKHVASDSSYIYSVVFSDGTKYPATLVAQDPTNDIAFLKINSNKTFPYLKLSSSSYLQVGEQVVAIGYALGQFNNTVTSGIVSGLNRNVTAQDPSTGASESLSGVIQTTAQINPGNSGGPLLDLNGNVVGINSAVDQSAQGIGFAIPINQATSDVQSVEQSGKIVKPELGVRTVAMNSTYQAILGIPYNYGAYITSDVSGDPAVLPNSPAEKAGLQSGDLILSVNGTEINNQNPIFVVIGSQPLNSVVTIKYFRQGKVYTTTATLNLAF